jgi:hypothetical protein
MVERFRRRVGSFSTRSRCVSVYNLNVNDLMIPNVRMWDKGKVESLFPMHVAKRILDIPLFDMYDGD